MEGTHFLQRVLGIATQCREKQNKISRTVFHPFFSNFRVTKFVFRAGEFFFATGAGEVPTSATQLRRDAVCFVNYFLEFSIQNRLRWLFIVRDILIYREFHFSYFYIPYNVNVLFRMLT